MALGRNKPTVDTRRAGSVEAAFRRSLRAAVAGDWETAETWLERIVEADTSDLDAYHALARLYRERGDIGRAIRMHQNLLLRADLGRTQKAAARLELARDFDAGGFAERAAAGYEEVLGEQPRNAEALERRLALCLALREYDRGLALVKRYRRVDRDEAGRVERSLLLAMARAQADEGDADAARGTLKRCLRRDKTCAEAWSRLGELEAEKGRDAKAIDAWRRAVEAEPGRAGELLPRIEAGYSARKKPAEYEKFLRARLEVRPADAALHVALSRALKARGEAAEAIEVLARAIESVPSAVSLRVELGRQLLEAGQEREAQKAYSALLDALDQHVLATTAGPADDAHALESHGVVDGGSS